MAAKTDKNPHIKAVCVDGDGELTLFWLPIGERNPPLSSPRMELYRLVDRMLACVTNQKFSFLSELNDLQSNDDGETVFENKSDIPLRVVNLVLAPYNIVIEED